MDTFEKEPVQPEALPGVPAEAPAAAKIIRRLSTVTLTWEMLVWAAIGLSAVLTRFWNLGARAMSHDESLHVYFSYLLSNGGGYVHNPMMHGPLLFELTAVFDAIFGANDFTSRIVPALFGIFLVLGIPLLLRPWLGRAGALFTSLLLLVSPYMLYFSRYNRHDIEEIAWALLALVAMFRYLRTAETGEAEKETQGEQWLLLLGGAVALMFSAMETAFFYLAIFASFLVLRLLVGQGFNWQRIRRAAEFDLLIVLATLGAFFSAPILLLGLNPLWNAITGQPFVPLTVFNTYGIEWASGPSGMRVWGLMIFFWLAATAIGVLWGRLKWIKIAAIFLFITTFLFTTAYRNKAGIGTGFVGSLGYWLSQQGVARGSQPWYFYFIVTPLYEYLPLIGGVVAWFYFAFRRRTLPALTQLFVLLVGWWAFWIFTGLTLAGEKMPWLSTHITTPFILLTGWLVGDLLYRGFLTTDNTLRLTRARAGLAALPFVILLLLTARTSYLVNYVNYDYTTEFIDYAHGAPGVTWLASDVAKITQKIGQGKPITVAYDSANSWPLTWYLRSNSGFYGEQPSPAAVQNMPVVVAGSSNWEKVERFLGADYNRYDVIRIWWPMEDYKNLTWERIRFALTNPEMRQAVWNILWSRDYALYAKLTNETLDPPAKWPLEDRMRVYIRKDIAAQIPDLKLKQAQIEDIPPQQDLYAAQKTALAPDKILQGAGLNMPRNLTIAPDGSLYVVDTGNSRIVHLDAQGNLLGSWGSRTPAQPTPADTTQPAPAAEPGTFNEPWGLALDAQGNVYVADTWNHRIQKFDPNGKFLLQWGVPGVSADGPDRFWGPRGVAVAPDGNVYVTDTGNRRVAVFDPQGKFLFAFAQDGESSLNEPVGIAINPQGQVYVADTWNMRVAIFDLTGKLLRSFPVQAWKVASINDKPYIALDSAGRVYLTEPEMGRVLIFDGNGAARATFGQSGDASALLNLPTGIQIGADKDIWVADAANNRILHYPAFNP